MSAPTKSDFKGAKLIDYTGSHKGFKHLKKFDREFTELLRNCKDGSKAVVIIDRGFCGRHKSPYIVRDHINLSGNNPLLGPNDPIGERFPIVQGIYFIDALPELNSCVTAGLKEGVLPDDAELDALRNMGADICSYNMVPSMLVAAHAGWKVLGILLSDGNPLTDEQLTEIGEIAGVK